jgi:hypothetical protein
VTANVFWIDGDPPPSTDRQPTMRHQRYAEALRGRPGRWALLADLESGSAGSIRSGQLVPYRPGGTFDAVVRRGRVYARYLGKAVDS